MHREIVITGDGSHTVMVNGILCHSRNGALAESRHIFINNGLAFAATSGKPLRILEVGMGTGLNVMLTVQFAAEHNADVHYTALEPFPLTTAEVQQLNYPLLPNMGNPQLFQAIHSAAWEVDEQIADRFTLHKSRSPIADHTASTPYSLVYYDAFAPADQPEMWQSEVFNQLYRAMEPDAILVTYCAKGEVRRALQRCGFRVSKLPGPPGKREMLRAQRLG